VCIWKHVLIYLTSDNTYTDPDAYEFVKIFCPNKTYVPLLEAVIQLITSTLKGGFNLQVCVCVCVCVRAIECVYI
jgi:hypothetical protein